MTDDKKNKGVKMSFGGIAGHPLQFERAQEKMTDKFNETPVDQDDYRIALTNDPAKARAELVKLHPMVAGKRPPKPVLVRLYAKLLGEYRGQPLDREETRILRRELIAATVDDDALDNIIDGFPAG